MGNQFGLFLLEQATKKANAINSEARLAIERAPYNKPTCRVGSVDTPAIAYVQNYFFRNINELPHFEPSAQGFSRNLSH